MLKAGQRVRIKYKNIMWDRRDRYASYMHIPQFWSYEGTVVYESWYSPSQFGLTTEHKWHPVRTLEKENVVEVDDTPVAIKNQEERTVRTRTVYKVQGSKGSIYQVTIDPGGAWCSCPGYQFRRRCKHVDGLVKPPILESEQ